MVYARHSAFEWLELPHTNILHTSKALLYAATSGKRVTCTQNTTSRLRDMRWATNSGSVKRKKKLPICTRTVSRWHRPKQQEPEDQMLALTVQPEKG